MASPFPHYDPQQQAYYHLLSASGSPTYYDAQSGNTFQIVRGTRLYCDRTDQSFYTLAPNGQRVYYESASQFAQLQSTGYGQPSAQYGQTYGQDPIGYGSSSTAGPIATSPSYNGAYDQSYNQVSQQLTRTYDEFDRDTGVQSTWTTGPAQTITEHTAFSLGAEASSLIQGTKTGATERLDPIYTMHRSSYFVVGRVFEMLWVEPRGGTSGAASVITETSRFNDIAYTKIRKFVVIMSGHRHCSALGIFTYDGQGVAKSSVKKSDHAIVYDGRLRDNPPGPSDEEVELTRREDPMRREKIRLSLNNNERWHPMSRVNLGKTYTIEHNVKLKDIGMVHPDSVDELVSLYWQVLLDNTSRSDPKYRIRHRSAIRAVQRSRADSATSGR